jgi:tetratricopeptide (TPR) repeat protein
MSGRLNLKSRFGIVLLSGIILSTGLYLLPKTVVTDDASSSQSAGQQQTSKESEHPQLKLTKEQQSALAEIKNASLGEVDKFREISQFFQSVHMYDSSAVYAVKYAESTNDINSWLDAGDKYYQAFSLSLSPVEKDRLAEKTREIYNKALAVNPSDLHAKTNIAMTYVSSSSPMQGITQLRQVLEENPRYVPAIMSMGALSIQSNQYDKAADRFEEVLRIDSENINAKLGLAYSLIELNKKERAKALLGEVLKSDLDEVLKTEVVKTLESLN